MAFRRDKQGEIIAQTRYYLRNFLTFARTSGTKRIKMWNVISFYPARNLPQFNNFLTTWRHIFLKCYKCIKMNETSNENTWNKIMSCWFVKCTNNCLCCFVVASFVMKKNSLSHVSCWSWMICAWNDLMIYLCYYLRNAFHC